MRLVAARPRTATLPDWPPRQRADTIDVEDGDIVAMRTAPPSSRSLRIASSRAPLAPRVARESLWQMAARHAGALAVALGARAVLIHLHDDHELRVVGAAGVDADDLLGESDVAATDFVARTLRESRSLTMCFEAGLPRVAPARLRRIGARWSLVAVPVVVASTRVALVEAVDADVDLRDAVSECERVAASLADALS
jgi:hypothetical protein